jgi:2-hydroxychromene-2-carboxylate isomerase
MRVDFYFDFLSPFAYLAHKKLPTFAKDLGIEWEMKPVVFAALLNQWGHKGPAEIPPKRVYVFSQCMRFARREGIPFTLPKYHPFNPITALRMALKEVSGKDQLPVIDALWDASWGQGRDLADKGELVSVLNEAKLPGEALLNKTNDASVKEVLKNNTTEAISLGIFGVPTFITEDKTLFWGLDAMADLERFLRGQDPLDKAKLAELLSHPAGASRL